MNSAQATPRVSDTSSMAHLGQIIAVASGKGGVGKVRSAPTLRSRWRRRGRLSGLLTPIFMAPVFRECWASRPAKARRCPLRAR